MNDNETVKTELQKFEEAEKSFQTNPKPSEKAQEKKEAKPDTQPVKSEQAQESLKAISSDVEKQLEAVEKKIEKAENEDSTDKRIKDKDRYITQLHEERKHLQEAQERYKNLISEFSDAIEFDEDGLPVKWNFDKVEKKESENKRPPEPTPEDDFETYTKKIVDIAKWEARQEIEGEKRANAEKESKSKIDKEIEEFESRRIEAINESMGIAVEMYPDFNNPESPIRQEAEKIFKENPHLAERTDFNLICARKAAKNLGMKPSIQTEEKPQKKETKIVDKPSLVSLGRHTSGVGNDNPILQKIADFEREEARFRAK